MDRDEVRDIVVGSRMCCKQERTDQLNQEEEDERHAESSVQVMRTPPPTNDLESPASEESLSRRHDGGLFPGLPRYSVSRGALLGTRGALASPNLIIDTSDVRYHDI